MKNIYPLLAATVFAGGLATAAIAEDPVKGAPGSASPPHGTSAMPSPMSKDSQGEHTMSGTISKIDQNGGTLSLRTDKEILDLHFPPSVLANFKEGDQVTVHLGIAKKPAPQTSVMERK